MSGSVQASAGVHEGLTLALAEFVVQRAGGTASAAAADAFTTMLELARLAAESAEVSAAVQLGQAVGSRGAVSLPGRMETLDAGYAALAVGIAVSGNDL